MKRLFTRVAAVAALVLLVAACSAPLDRMTVRLTPSGTLGYEISSSGELTITNRNVVFRNAPGEPVAMIHGFSALYRNAAGVVVEEVVAEPNNLSIVVPAGYICQEPDPVVGCDPLASGNRLGWGQESSQDDGQVQLLPATVAAAHAAAPMGASGWVAEITFHGTNGRGQFDVPATFFIIPPN